MEWGGQRNSEPYGKNRQKSASVLTGDPTADLTLDSESCQLPRLEINTRPESSGSREV